MTNLDIEVERLAKRITVARLGLAQGGPVVLLEALLGPVASSIEAVTAQMMQTEQPTFKAVDEPIGPATTSVLADMVSPVPGRRDPWGERRGTRDQPVVLDVGADSRDWPDEMYRLDHVHDASGRCRKNRYMRPEECQC